MLDRSRPIDHRALAADLFEAVLEAGRVEMRHYAAGVEVQAKADHSPVTIADQEAEAVLLAALARIAPDIPVIAEESVALGRIPRIGERFFLVDPLDGTREFINRRGEFTVNVALIDRGRPVFGIVYAPAIDDLYVTLGERLCARASIGPNDRIAGPSDPRLVPIRVATPDPTALRAVASRSHLTPETEAFLARYRIGTRGDSGSSLKFCAIARGDADIYPRLGPTMEWDTAAGHAVLLTAGGSVTRVDGEALGYGHAEAGFKNPHFVAWGAPHPFASHA